MRKLTVYLIRFTVAFVITFVTAHLAFAQDPKTTQNACLRRITDNPTNWIHESLPLTQEGRAAHGGVCRDGGFQPNRVGGRVEAPVRTTWNGKSVAIQRGLCNGAFPTLQIDVPGEQNRIYIIDSLISVFSWEQAHRLGCDGFAASEADKVNWRLPARNQKAHLKFMMAGGLMAPIAQVLNSGKNENVFATFVDEENRNDSIACYGTSFNGYIFSTNFLVNAVFGLRDEDFANRSASSSGAAAYLAGTRDHAVAILIKYALGRPIYDNEAMNRKAVESLSRRLDARHAQEIKRLAMAGGRLSEAGAESARNYILINVDWTVAIENQSIRRDVEQKNAIVATTNSFAPAINRDRAAGGGLRVYCITEQRR